MEPTPAPNHQLKSGNSRTAYIVVGILAIVVLIAVAIPFTLNIFRGGGQTAIDKKVIQQDTKMLDSYRSGTTDAAQKAYVEAADQHSRRFYRVVVTP